jgi:hypothetical protein
VGINPVILVVTAHIYTYISVKVSEFLLTDFIFAFHVFFE